MINLEALDDRVKLTFPNECTIYEAAEIKEKLIASISDLSNEIEADLSNIDDLDTTGVQLFLSLKKFLNNEGRNLHYTNPSEKVKTVFKYYNLSYLIEEEK